MSSQNPYQAPQASLERDDYQDFADLNLSGNPISIGDSLSWIGESWQLFKAAPGIWIVNIIICGILMLVAGAIPFLNFILQPMVSAVMMAGFMLGCRAIDDGDSLSIGHLFGGLQQHTSQLLILGGIQIVLSILMFVILMVTGGILLGGSLLMSGGMGALGNMAGASMFAQGLGFGMIVFVLVAFVLGLFIYSAILFAPALVVLHDVSPLEAVKASFKGALKNFLPLLIFGIVMGIIAMISAIPLFLGLLITVPMMMASVYAGYKQIYL